MKPFVVYYYFGGNANANMLAANVIESDSTYEVRIALSSAQANDGSVTDISGPTTQAVGANAQDKSDSNGALNGSYVFESFSTGGLCEDDYSFDFGFSAAPPSCEFSITSTSSQNGSGSGPFTAEWQVIVSHTSPAGDITYQRNSLATITFSPDSSLDTLIITGVEASGGFFDTIRDYFAGDRFMEISIFHSLKKSDYAVICCMVDFWHVFC